MPKRLIIGISVALVVLAAVVFAIVLARSRALTEEPAIDTGVSSGTGTSSGGLGSTTPPGGGTAAGQGTSTSAPVVPQAGPCGDGVCSEGESWCKPDCGSVDERFLGSIKAEKVTSRSITLVWKTDGLSTGEVSYGVTERYELGKTASLTPSRSHEALISGLSPGGGYYLRLKVKEADGREHEVGPMFFELPGDDR